jgi:hypothetical protein
MHLEPLSPERKRELLFAELDMPIPDKKLWAQKILAFPKEHWFLDPDRNTWVLPLKNQTGGYGYNNNLNGIAKKDHYVWTPAAFPELVGYCERYIFPWTGSLCRLAILRTPAGTANKIHIDCSPSAMGTIQHKFRMVIQGRTDTLFFLTHRGVVRAPATDKAFLIDGSWVHGMENDDNEDKLTLCLGSPFVEGERYPPLAKFVSKQGLEQPADLTTYFEEKYRNG